MRPVCRSWELGLLRCLAVRFSSRGVRADGDARREQVCSFPGVEPEPFEIGDHLIEASGKLHLLDKLLAFLHPRCVAGCVFCSELATHRSRIMSSSLTSWD